ncbi:hypothetical protein, partial [Streptosporangium amethystogenes]
MIGWTDCERLFLLPSAAGAFVTAYTGRLGSPIDITPRAMGEAMRVADVIPGSVSRGAGGRPVHRHTIAKKIPALGRKRDVWALRWTAPDAGPEEIDHHEAAGPPDRPPAPCVTCGEPCTLIENGRALHAGCDAPDAPPAPPAPMPVAEELDLRATPGAHTEPVLAVAADADGLYLSSGAALPAGAALDDMAAFLAGVVELMPDGGSVAITGDVAARLGYPDA